MAEETAETTETPASIGYLALYSSDGTTTTQYNVYQILNAGVYLAPEGETTESLLHYSMVVVNPNPSPAESE